MTPKFVLGVVVGGLIFMAGYSIVAGGEDPAEARAAEHCEWVERESARYGAPLDAVDESFETCVTEAMPYAGSDAEMEQLRQLTRVAMEGLRDGTFVPAR